MYVYILVTDLGPLGQPVNQAGGNQTPGDGDLVSLCLACKLRKYSVLAVYTTKRSRGVLGAVRCNARIRKGQSRASGAVNLFRYGRFVSPWGSPGDCWGMPAGSQEGP